ncbi:MAG TPA: hypothetical protein VMP08_08400 [Anaerolineae bacterium]|nr:hypothetical protein [Anaerolineae bacterium]
MNNFELFEDILINNDFSTQDKPVFNIPKGVDVPTEYRLRDQAYREMNEANYQAVRTVASTKYELIEQLIGIYLQASDVQRQRIREYSGAVKQWRDVFHWWEPKSALLFQDPVQFLQLSLARLSILDGDYDFRDTLVSLATTWHTLEELGVDPEPSYHEALSWGGQLAKYVTDMLNPERRRECCFKCASGKPHLRSAQ